MKRKPINHPPDPDQPLASVEAVTEWINLRKQYPRPVRSIFYRCFEWLVILLLTWIIVAFVNMAIDRLELTETLARDVVSVFFSAVLLTVLVLTLLRFIYELVYFSVYRYGIELEHLVINKGLLFRSRVSIPLARITDVSLTRTPKEILFFVHSLHIMKASTTNADTVDEIEGLSWKSAAGLQNHLLALMESTMEPVEEKAADKALMESAEPVPNNQVFP